MNVLKVHVCVCGCGLLRSLTFFSNCFHHLYPCFRFSHQISIMQCTPQPTTQNINRNQMNARKREETKLKNAIVMDAKHVLESCELFSNFQFLVVIKRARKTVHKFKINENIYFAFRSSSTHNTKQNYYVLLMSKHNFISTIYICICICIVVEANFAIEVVKMCECVCDEHNFEST